MFWRYNKLKKELYRLEQEISTVRSMIKDVSEITFYENDASLSSYFSGLPRTRPVKEAIISLIDALDMKIVYSPPASDKISIVPKEKEQK